jgi:hypothetical protein
MSNAEIRPQFGNATPIWFNARQRIPCCCGRSPANAGPERAGACARPPMQEAHSNWRQLWSESASATKFRLARRWCSHLRGVARGLPWGKGEAARVTQSAHRGCLWGRRAASSPGRSLSEGAARARGCEGGRGARSGSGRAALRSEDAASRAVRQARVADLPPARPERGQFLSHLLAGHRRLLGYVTLNSVRSLGQRIVYSLPATSR